MKQKIHERFRAKELRKKGYSLAEIVQELGVSKSSASTWVRNVPLSKSAEKRLLTRITAGQLASQKSKRAITLQKEVVFAQKARDLIKNNSESIYNKKILCALIYHCEGNKSVRGGVSFTNSDPQLMTLFLSLFRVSFKLEEKKFSVCVHLHPYHHKDTQLKFWSKTTNIALSQFMRPWLKQNSGLYKKDGYQGCVNVRYYDTDVARELKALAIEYMNYKGD